MEIRNSVVGGNGAGRCYRQRKKRVSSRVVRVSLVRVSDVITIKTYLHTHTHTLKCIIKKHSYLFFWLNLPIYEKSLYRNRVRSAATAATRETSDNGVRTILRIFSSIHFFLYIL